MTSRTLLLVGAALISGCGDDGSSNNPNPDARPDSAPTPDTPDVDAAVTDRCTTDVSGTANVQLCTIPDASTAQHVRIAKVQAPSAHASVAVVFGGDTAPMAFSGDIPADQLRVLFYGGGPAGPGMTIAPVVELQYGTQTETISDNATWITAGADVCFDVHDGTATTAPSFALWVTGEKGADCADTTTLTAATAYGLRSYWHGAKGAISKSKVWFHPAAGSTQATPAVTLSKTAVLTETDVAAATSCTTNWVANTDWQQLCDNAGGPVRHVVMTGAASTTNNHFFYTVLGQDAAPTGSPATADGKLIVTGGKSNSGTSWTYFRFGTTVQTMPASFANDDGDALYTDGPSTVCYDVGSTSTGGLRVVFWATGKGGADCADRSTLTEANAVFDSSTDTTSALWTSALATGKLNFMKTSNTGSSFTSVSVSSEPAVLD